MCGIAGFVGQGSRETLEKMTDALFYRGPDGSGYYFNEAQGAGLGHRRLAIIDVSGGGQPIFNEDRTVAVIFNGEIYNFQELRERLEPRHKFTSRADTEVIVHLYEEEGEELFKKLNGMFAIALFDERNKKLVLARDRIGKKPLYWGIFNGTLVFGSELKALARHPLFKKELDLESLGKYLSYEYVPTSRSIWKDVSKLEPATYLVWQNGKLSKGKFWDPNFVLRDLSLPEAVFRLDKCIDESVRQRLVSDVPLGVFLSGGIDSATIAYYAQKNSPQPIKTFSISFLEKTFDESFYARQAAKFLGTDHLEKQFSAKDLLGLLPEVFNLLDEPLADASILPTFLLSRFTRERVTVALSGDGGDELFAGYPTFQAEILARFYQRLPLFLRRLFLEKIINSLPAGDGNFNFNFRIKKFIQGFDVEPKYRHQRWLGSFGRTEQAQLLSKEAGDDLKNQNLYEEVDRYSGEASAAEADNALLFTYLRTYLMDGVLVKTDRASMFNSLEVRAPFLDYHLVDFVDGLPYNLKLRGLTSKYILKKLMKNKLPSAIVNRPKKGFGIPLAAWLKNELRPFCEEVLSAENMNKFGLFNFDFVDKLKREHFTGRRDNHKQLWTLMAFQMWQNKWGKIS